jgi:hypothetical protein
MIPNRHANITNRVARPLALDDPHKETNTVYASRKINITAIPTGRKRAAPS